MLSLITDRTQLDVVRLTNILKTPRSLRTPEEQQEVESCSSKGAYNYTDLNRVTQAMEALNSELLSLGYISGYTPVVVHDESEVTPSLPDDYTELEYIESSGTQYINTGIKPTETTVVDAVMQITASQSGNFTLFGVQLTGANFCIKARPSSDDFIYRTGDKAATKIASGISFLEKYAYYLSSTEARVGDYSTQFSTSAFKASVSMTIIGVQGASSQFERGSARIFKFDIFDGETLVRKFIPCINPVGDVGLYDTVTSEFFGNAGTGSFIAGPIVAPDGSDFNTLLLLHGESTTDSSLYRNKVTNNGVSVSTEQSKFGGNSLYFDGSSYLTTPAWKLDGDEFTIDWWEYVTGSPGARFTTQFSASKLIFGGLLVTYTDGNGYISSVQGNWDIASSAPIADNEQNRWIHRAVVKTSSSIMAFKDGTLVWQMQNTKPLYYDSSNLSALGVYYQVGNAMYSGYIDEFRVSNVARWTEDFTPPTEPYKVVPSSVPQPSLDKYTWYENDKPTSAQLDQYLTNVANIRDTLSKIPTSPNIPESMKNLTFQGANNIEQVLLDIEGMIINMKSIVNLGWALGIADVGLYGGV